MPLHPSFTRMTSTAASHEEHAAQTSEVLGAELATGGATTTTAAPGSTLPETTHFESPLSPVSRRLLTEKPTSLAPPQSVNGAGGAVLSMPTTTARIPAPTRAPTTTTTTEIVSKFRFLSIFNRFCRKRCLVVPLVLILDAWRLPVRLLQSLL